MPFELETLDKLMVFFINAFGIFLGGWVLIANWKEKLNRRFAVMTITGLLWVNFAYLAFLPKDILMSVFWYRLNYISALLTFLAFYSFYILTFLKEEKRHPIIDKFILISVGIAIFLLGFTNIIIKGAKAGGLGMELVYGNFGDIVFYGFSFILLLLITVWLIKKYFVLSPQEKLRVQYFFIGNILWIVFNTIFNVFSPLILHSVKYQHFGDYSVILFLFFTAYAIVKRNLFGIKVVLTQLLIGLIAILLFVNFIISGTTFEYIWKGALFAAFVIFGWLLVKSVIKEIKQKEQLDVLATQLANANFQLENAYKKLKKLDDAKSEFMSITSHQLRTPLAAIKGYSSMLLEGDYGALADKAVKPVQGIYQSTERLINLVNSLLSISRIEAGKIKLEPSETSIGSLIMEAVKELQPQAQAKNLYVRFKRPKEPLPKAMLDQERIRNVILNLIDNALKYTTKGGIKISAEMKETFRQEPLLRITVADTGEGLNREELEKLFESFSRAGAGKKLWVDGAGLGLYIAKQFVIMHGGRIWAESEGKGKGSQFIVELPLKPTKGAQAPNDMNESVEKPPKMSFL